MRVVAVVHYRLREDRTDSDRDDLRAEGEVSNGDIIQQNVELCGTLC